MASFGYHKQQSHVIGSKKNKRILGVLILLNLSPILVFNPGEIVFMKDEWDKLKNNYFLLLIFFIYIDSLNVYLSIELQDCARLLFSNDAFAIVDLLGTNQMYKPFGLFNVIIGKQNKNEYLFKCKSSCQSCRYL